MHRFSLLARAPRGSQSRKVAPLLRQEGRPDGAHALSGLPRCIGPDRKVGDVRKVTSLKLAWVAQTREVHARHFRPTQVAARAASRCRGGVAAATPTAPSRRSCVEEKKRASSVRGGGRLRGSAPARANHPCAKGGSGAPHVRENKYYASPGCCSIQHPENRHLRLTVVTAL